MLPADIITAFCFNDVSAAHWSHISVTIWLMHEKSRVSWYIEVNVEERTGLKSIKLVQAWDRRRPAHFTITIASEHTRHTPLDLPPYLETYCAALDHCKQ